MNRLVKSIQLAALILMCSLALAGENDTEGYLQVTGPCRLEFPRDHGAHPGYRTEWWYYTGNLASEDGHAFGFQLTIFRTQISPSVDNENSQESKSAWRTSQVYFGHAAISDIANGNHLQAENLARGALNMAGARQDAGVTTIWLHDWSIRIDSDAHHISADTPEFGIRLKHVPLKPPIQHGDQGYSPRGSTAGYASCYYSLTRMDTEGELRIGNRSFTVRGQGWMDQDFSSRLLEPGIVGWDWFSLQLSDHSEIMFYLGRTESGDLHPASSGTFILPDAATLPLALNALDVDVLDRWKSPQTGAIYPSRWRLRIEPLGVDVTIAARLADQEMITLKSTGVIYWEGSVSVGGQSRGQTVKGTGYVELTGYAGALDKPL
jgi:predicted secreted hydrolase